MHLFILPFCAILSLPFVAFSQEISTDSVDALAAQANNPLKFSKTYGAIAASFTLPDNVLLKYGRTIILRPETKVRKETFIQALGSVDQAIFNVTGESAIKRTLSEPIEDQTEETLKNNPMTLPANSREFSYVELRDYLQQGLISAPDDTARAFIRTDLARLNITFERYEEALGIIENFPKNDRTNLPKDAEIRTLMGIAYALNGEKEKATSLLSSDGNPEIHRLLWLAYVSEDADESLKLFTRAAKIIGGYPPEHDELLTRAYAKRLLESEARSPEVIPLLEELAVRLNGQDLAPETLYLLSQTYKQFGDTTLALKTLADVAESGENPTAYRAKYDFVTHLQKKGDLSNRATIQALESLARIWRGDDIEQRILLDLGRLYLSEKEFRKALNYLKDYVRHFPDGNAREQVAYLMTQNFLAAFNQTNALMTDDLGFLSLYYDFRELTPADGRGDQLIQDVASRLERLNLFESAKKLFEQQLEFRISSLTEKVDVTLDLSRLHRKNKNPKRSLELLKKINIELLNSRRKNDVLTEKARAHFDLMEYDKAKKLLISLGTDTARDLLIQIAWAQQEADTLIALIAPMFETEEHAGFESAPVRNKFVKLAYAYAYKRDRAAISKMKKTYPDTITDFPEVADAIAFALARSGEHDVVGSLNRPVGRLSKEMGALNKLMADYQVVAASVQERKASRELFNKKMQYMERRGGF